MAESTYHVSGVAHIAKNWPVPDWKAVLNRFAIIYENRLPLDGSLG